MTRSAIVCAAVLAALAASAAAQEPAADQRGHMEQGVWVPEGNTLAEVRERQAANREAAQFAESQEAENSARIEAGAQAQAAYEAALARVEQEKTANEAKRARDLAEYEAAMTRWRADVAACEAGERDRCAPVPAATD